VRALKPELVRLRKFATNRRGDEPLREEIQMHIAMFPSNCSASTIHSGATSSGGNAVESSSSRVFLGGGLDSDRVFGGSSEVCGRSEAHDG
jgi:hypothetical protein